MARASPSLLSRLPYPTLLLTLKKAITSGRLDPNRRKDLDKIYRRIHSLIL